MTQDQQRLQVLYQTLVATLRARLNQLFGVSGQRLATGSGSLVSLIVLLFLGFNLFLFLNIALGFWLGSVMGGSSPALGFLYLSGIYVVLILLYLLIRRSVERSVRDRVARGVNHVTDNLNNDLDSLPALRVDPAYREAYISGEPHPYHALELRSQEARSTAERASKELYSQVDYLSTNYTRVLGSVAASTLEHRYPMAKLLTPLLGLLPGGRSSRGVRSGLPTSGGRATTSRLSSGPIGKAMDRLGPWMPYLKLAYQVVRPVATAFVLGRTQSWLLRLLGIGRRR